MYVQPQDAAANWNGKAQVVPLAERPTLTVRGLLVPSGGHLSDDLPVCPVLADSKCLFYCAVASHDAEKWVKTHGPRDEPKHVEQARRELQDAKATLELVADRAVSAGEPDVATRLRGQGTGSYTGLDEMKYMAKVMGRIIIVQTGEVQVMYGDVDVGGLHYNGGRCWTQSSTLGAFEELGASERFLISDLPSGVSQAYEANPDVLAWLEIPGAASGNDDFVNLFADLHTAMAEDDTLIRDPPRDQQTTLGRTDMIEREIASVRPDWLGPMQHLILGLLSTYRCRLSDVFFARTGDATARHFGGERVSVLLASHKRLLVEVRGAIARARLCFRQGAFADAGRFVPFIANEICGSGRQAVEGCRCRV